MGESSIFQKFRHTDSGHQTFFVVQRVNMSLCGGLGWWFGHSGNFTIWLFNIAVENCPFIDDFPIKTSIHKGFSMAMLNNQMVVAAEFLSM